jgi:hypothetical protein
MMDVATVECTYVRAWSIPERMWGTKRGNVMCRYRGCHCSSKWLMWCCFILVNECSSFWVLVVVAASLDIGWGTEGNEERISVYEFVPFLLGRAAYVYFSLPFSLGALIFIFFGPKWISWWERKRCWLGRMHVLAKQIHKGASAFLHSLSLSLTVSQRSYGDVHSILCLNFVNQQLPLKNDQGAKFYG